VPAKFEVRALPVPEKRGVVAKLQTSNFDEEDAIEGRVGSVRKSVNEFLWAVHSNFSSICTRFRVIAAFALQHATFSPPHIYIVSQKFPHVPLGLGGSPFV